jgi:hypothetical protein
MPGRFDRDEDVQHDGLLQALTRRDRVVTLVRTAADLHGPGRWARARAMLLAEGDLCPT